MSLEQFLQEAADKAMTLAFGEYGFCERYSEDDNPDALAGDAWLESGTSYIWRVGVLTRIDANKADYIYAWIGHERDPGRYELVGSFRWEDGENDDPGRCLPRYVALLACHHPALEND